MVKLTVLFMVILQPESLVWNPNKRSACRLLKRRWSLPELRGETVLYPDNPMNKNGIKSSMYDHRSCIGSGAAMTAVRRWMAG